MYSAEGAEAVIGRVVRNAGHRLFMSPAWGLRLHYGPFRNVPMSVASAVAFWGGGVAAVAGVVLQLTGFPAAARVALWGFAAGLAVTTVTGSIDVRRDHHFRHRSRRPTRQR